MYFIRRISDLKPGKEVILFTVYYTIITEYFMFNNTVNDYPGECTCSCPSIKTPPGLMGCQGDRFSPEPLFTPSW